MKIKTKQITVTAIMLALSLAVIQFIKLPLSISGQSVGISGALINLIIIVDTLYCGLLSGMLLAIIIPVLSFVLTASPIISSVPIILPCIMIGNAVLVLFAWFVRGKKLELNLMPLSLVIGSFAKAGIMTLLIVKWALPQFGGNLPAKVINMAKITYSSTQLIAALLGTFLACIIWPVLKIALKRIK
jgi:hypothetical protein